MVLLVAELATGCFAVELPVDSGAVAIHLLVPGSGFPAQSLQLGDSSTSQALPREDTNFDFRLIEPTSVGRRVVNGEAVPDFGADLRAIEVSQGLAAVDIQVIHHQVDGLSFRVLHGQVEGHLRELKRRAVWRRECEMPAGLRLYRAENVGRTATFVFVILSRFPSRLAAEAGRTSACNVTGFSSKHTTGCLGSYGCSYVYSTSSILAM